MTAAVRIRTFAAGDDDAVIALWREAGLLRPWNDPAADIARKRACQADGFVVAVDDGGRIVGTMMAGYDGHRGWANYLAVDPALRHRGVGRALMRHAADWLRAQGCPKLNVQVRRGNDAAALFYTQLGFRPDATDSYGLRLIADAPASPVPADPRPLVLASRNAKKARELSALLAPLGGQLRPVSDFSDCEPDENAPSFVENALIKARHAARVSGLPALADDSGLEVDALGGAPGVRSARYAGVHGDDAANNAQLLNALSGVEDARRGARFVAVLVLLRHADDPCPVIAEGFWPGRILQAPRGNGGFGYDPLFWVPELGASAAELPADVKARIGHRGRAMRLLLERLGHLAW